MKRVALYARVSKEEINGTTQLQDPNNQLIQLKKYCDAMDGWEIVGEYVDRISGGNGNRPGLNQLKEDAKSGKFDLVFIWALDRLSREGMLETLSHIEDLKVCGVAIKSLQESWADTSSDGVGELMIAIFAWVAKQERKKIQRRTKAGLERTRAEGVYVGNVPFGFVRAESGGIKYNDEEQQVLERARYLKHTLKMSNNKIADDLNKNKFKKRGKKFTRLGIIKMLKDRSRFEKIAEIN